MSISGKRPYSEDGFKDPSPKQVAAEDRFSSLPSEVALRILSYLPSKDLKSMTLVSKKAASLTAVAMKDKLQTIYGWLQPLIKTLPEKDQDIPEFEEFAFSAKKSLRPTPNRIFQALLKQFKSVEEHQKSALPAIARVLHKSLNLPPADTAYIAEKIFSYDSKDEFYFVAFYNWSQDSLPITTTAETLYKVVTLIDNPKDKDLLLGRIICIYIHINELEKALDLTKKMQGDRKTELIYYIIQAYIRRNDLDGILAAAKEYLNAPLYDKHYITDVLTNTLYKNYIRSNNLGKALEIAILIPLEHLQSLRLSDITTIYRNRGDLPKALTIAKMISKVDPKCMHIRLISEAYAALGDLKTAFAVAKEMPITSWIWNSDYGNGKTSTLITLLKTYITKHGIEAGYAIAKEVPVEFADQGLHNADLQSQLLRKVCDAYMDQEDLDKAFIVAKEIAHDHTKFCRLEEIYDAYQAKGDFKNALIAAKESPWNLLDKYKAIIKVYISRNDLETAFTIATEMPPSDYKDSILEKIKVKSAKNLTSQERNESNRIISSI